MLPRTSLRILVTLAALGSTLACSDSEETGTDSRTEPRANPGPPFLLTEVMVENVIACVTDLKDAFRQQNPQVNAQSVPFSIGVGITYHVKGSEKITAAHGFDSNQAFEQALSHVQFTLPVAMLGEHRGLDGQAMRYQLDNFKQSMTKELEATRRDQSLSTMSRRTRELELEAQIADIDRRVEETRSVAESMSEMSRAIPDQNVAAVKKYTDKLLVALDPLK